MVELWVYRVFLTIGWFLVGLLIADKRRRRKVFGDLVEDSENGIFLHCPYEPSELLKHKYVNLRVVKIPRK